MKITALVPVYRVPKRAKDILGKLMAMPYVDKEIIVIVDGSTNPEIESALEPYRAAITIHYNNEQLGKTESLNRVALRHVTDVFLILDNDIELPDDPAYLDKVATNMERYDLIEIPKEAIATTFISRMMAMEFLSFAMLSFTMAKLAKKSPSMNGAACAIRALLFRMLDGFRPVINEDMDFAARAFQLHAAFGYPRELKVRNEAPDTVRDWVVQRKRWALNNILWIKENFLLILTHFFRTPALFLSTVLFFLPFLASIVVFFVIRRTGLLFLLPLIFMMSQHLYIFTGLFLWPSHLQLILGGGWLPVTVGLMIAALTFFGFSRILRFRFNPVDFVLYYFIYSPVWMLANVVMIIALVLGIDIKTDWKITT